jgi:hypothetical protein
MFFYNKGGVTIFMLIYVDDIVVASSLETVVETELKIRCGGMNRDYTKMTNLYIITLISIKNRRF